MLFSIYKIYKKEGMKINKKVKDVTAKILKEQNDVYNFITDIINNNILVKDNSERVSLQDLFKLYCNEGYKYTTQYTFNKDIQKIFPDFEIMEGHARQKDLCKFKLN